MTKKKSKAKNDPIQTNRFKRELREFYIDIVWGFVCGDGHIAGRMTAPGEIDPTKEWQPLAKEYLRRGFKTRAEVAADMKQRWVEFDAADPKSNNNKPE